ncbi:MAG: PEFG-CTERM domain-containing protein, partial [Nitrosopumilus sp.]|nr:PEFG-CTERM domain-containing protein [Nitrosopumilus sp.]NNL52651.1 PEFG-CTERM domain-containing protein [Nitrosopumilus sp.]
MKTKAISSFFVLFAIVAGIGATTPAAFADHSEVTIVPAAGSGAPGCEETADGCYIPGTATVDVGGVVIMSNTDSAA